MRGNARDRRLVRLVATYPVVFAVMVGWWLALQLSTGVGAPFSTIAVAYAGPLIAWFVLTRWR